MLTCWIAARAGGAREYTEGHVGSEDGLRQFVTDSE